MNEQPLAQQLSLILPARAQERPPLFTVTRPMRKHKRCNQIIEQVQYVRRYYPELESLTLKVGLTRAASGMAIMGGTEIWLNPARSSYHTIAHEFIHLLQARNFGVPQGERSCDVFSLARHWTLNDVPPSYVKIPTRLIGLNGKIGANAGQLIFKVAVEAVERRGNGLRNYISFFEKQLREEARANSFFAKVTRSIRERTLLR